MNSPSANNTIKIYPQRWLVLLSFSMFAFMISVPFVQYSPILDQAVMYYKVSSYNSIVWFSNIYYLCYMIVSIPSLPLQQNYLGPTIIIGSMLLFIGCTTINYFAGDYWIAVGVYVLIGSVQVIQMNVPPCIKLQQCQDIADRWFPPQERTVATTIGTLVVYLGLNYGFIVPSTFVSSDLKNPELIKQQIAQFNCINVVLSGIAFILCGLFVRSSPPTPPSFTSVELKNDLSTSLLYFVSSPSNLMDIATMSAFAGISWSFITVITVLLTPYNYSQTQIGLIGLSFQVSGMFSGVTAALFIDNQIGKGQAPSYDFWLKLLLTTSYIGMILLSFFLKYENLHLCCLLSGMVGFGLNAYFSIAIQSLVEKFYPCSELSIATAILFVAEGFGFSGDYFVNIAFFQEYGMWVLTGLSTPFIIYLLVCYKTQLKRTDTENELQTTENEQVELTAGQKFAQL